MTTIVLDTNVVSELMKAAPAQSVTSWVDSTGGRGLRTTSVTLAEIRFGIERLPEGRCKDLLRATADEVFGAFSDEILPFDAAAAAHYAAVVIHRDRLGTPIDGFDAQIAAICRVHDASLATRNTQDFEDTGVHLINPWRL